MSDYILKGAAGAAGAVVAAAGETKTPTASGNFAFVMPLGGDVTLNGHAGGPTGLSSSAVLSQDVSYPFKFSSVTIDGASAGSLVCFEQPLS